MAMYLKTVITAALIFSLLVADAQLTWPDVSKQTKPWARWWWQGSAVNKKDLTWSLEQYKSAGIGGLEITPIYGVKGYEQQFIEFLSPRWMEMLDYTLKEAKRLGLAIDLANGTGWPFGGPTTDDNNASKTIIYKSYQLNGGDTLPGPVVYLQAGFVRTANAQQVDIEDLKPNISENKNLQSLALDQVQFPGKLPLQLLMAYSEKGNVVDITNQTDSNGKLRWTAPEGKWTLYALFEGLHGKMVERAAPGGEGYAIDHFSAEAIEHYFKRFDTAFKGHDVSYIRALFNDSYEVDDAKGQANWTPGFLAEFQKRRGYNLKFYLPALFQQSDAQTNSRVIYDYRTTIGELILENFTEEWKKWGTTKGAIIRNQSHGSPASLLDLYGAIDIPETEGTDVMRYKFATSAAHVTGKKLASSETATWLKDHFLASWADVKKAVDLFFLGGVNHILYHGIAYSPQHEAWPGWLFYASVHFQPTNPQWRDFHYLNDYVARVQSFLQSGKPDNDILVYYPLNDRYADAGNELLQHFDGMEGFEGTGFKEISWWMHEHGYSFDFFSDRQLQKVQFFGKKLETGGNHYKTILLPEVNLIALTSFKKLIALAAEGATILVYGNLPKDVPGLYRLAERRNEFNALMKKLNFTIGNEKFKRAAIGRGCFIISENKEALLNAASITKETLTEKGLSFTRRKNAGGYTYFIANRNDTAVAGWFSLNAKAASVALFDAMTGKKGIGKFRTNSAGKFQVLVQLEPYQSIILQLFTFKKTGSRFPYIQTKGQPVKALGQWTVSFIDGGPVLPKTVKTDLLRSWTEFGDESTYQNFSGTAKYSISLRKPAGKASGWLLDLGAVNESAEVVLNGKVIAGLIGPSYKVVISAGDMKAINHLDITVSNLMANRIAYMDRNNIFWKKFYNINMPAKEKENRKNGLFNASEWKPLPSGLLGPVTLTPLGF